MTLIQTSANAPFAQWTPLLQQILQSVESNTVNPAKTFEIIHPKLRLYFRQQKKLKSDNLELIYRIYSLILSKHTSVNSPICVQLLDDLSSVLYLLSSQSANIEFPWSVLSEECCFAITELLGALFCRITPSLIKILFSQPHWPLLAHIYSTLLEIAEHASWRAVRVEALRSLSEITRPKNSTDCECELLANSVANFLPGLSQTVFRIITGDEKIGSSVKEAGLNTWLCALAVTFGRVLSPHPTATQTDSSNSIVVPFSLTWYDLSRANLADLIMRSIDNLLHVQLDCELHSERRLASAFTKWLTGLLSKCPALLITDCGLKLRDSILSALVLLIASNPLTDVTALALKKLNQFVFHDEASVLDPHLHVSLPAFQVRSRVLRGIVISSLCDNIASLSRFCASNLDECQLRKRLRTVYGYLQVLDSEGLSVLATCHDVFSRLCTSLADLLCFNTSFVELSSDSVKNECLKIALPDAPKENLSSGLTLPNLFIKSFHAFRDPKTLEYALLIAAQLSTEDSTFDLFIDTCRDLMTQYGDTYRSPCILLSIAALSGYLGNALIDWNQRHQKSIRFVTEFFASDLSSSISITTFKAKPAEVVSQDISHGSTDVKRMKDRAICDCLLLELFATASQLYRSKQCDAATVNPSVLFDELLRVCLLSTTCRAADSGIVGQTAKHCLRYVADNLGYSSVDDLLSSNADMLVSDITLNLHRFLLLCPDDDSATTNTTAIPDELLASLHDSCHTLETFFQHATVKIIPVIRPLLKQVLQCLDLTYEHHSALFLPALRYLMITCRHWHNERRSTEACQNSSAEFVPPPVISFPRESSCAYTSTVKNLHKLIRHTRRVHRLPASTLIDSRASDSDEDSTSVHNPEDTSRLYPDYLHIVEETMLRCINLLANADAKLRLLATDVLIEGFQTLSGEDNLLLPLAHKVWLSLMSRFRDQHAVVVERAFELLLVLTKVAGGFLRSRASSEIMSPLLSFLIRGSRVSSGASDSYRFLTSYRVQRHLLLELGRLCMQLGLASESLRPVVQMLILYLGNTQPRGLQQASQQSLCCIWRSDPGLIWTMLVAHLSPDHREKLFNKPPFAECQRIEVRWEDTERVELDPELIGELLGSLNQIVPVFEVIV